MVIAPGSSPSKRWVVFSFVVGAVGAAVGAFATYRAALLSAGSGPGWLVEVGAGIGILCAALPVVVVPGKLRGRLRPAWTTVATGAGVLVGGLAWLAVPGPAEPCPGCDGRLLDALSLIGPALALFLAAGVLLDPGYRRATGCCPLCGGVLRTMNAKQCRHCLHEWRSGTPRPMKSDPEAG